MKLITVAVALVLFYCHQIRGLQVEYELESSVEPSPPAALPLGTAVRLFCRANASALRRSAWLQWFDGGAPVGGENDRRIYTETTACGSIVTIANFSVVDYGRYACRCVNNYTQTEIDEIVHEGGAVRAFCSHPTAEVVLFPKSNPGDVFESISSLSDVGELNCSGIWARINRTAGSFQNFNSSDPAVVDDIEGEKLICYNQETLQVERIAYTTAIELSSFLPSRFDFPANGSTLYPYSYNYSTRGDQLRAKFTLCIISPNTSVSRIQIFEGNRNENISFDALTPFIEYPPNLSFPESPDIAVNFERDIRDNRYVNIHFSPREDPGDRVNRELVDHIQAALDGWYRCEANTSLGVISTWFYLNLTNLTEAELDVPAADEDATLVQCSTPSTPVPTVTASPSPMSSSPKSALPVPSSRATASPPQATSPSSTPLAAVIAVGVIIPSALCIIIGLFALLCVLAIRHRRQSMQPRKARRMSKIIGGRSSLRSDVFYSGKDIDSDRLCFTNPISLSIYGVSPVSRQMATCIQELQGSQWYFPYERLEMGEDIGSGTFGVVKKALAHSREDSAGAVTTVAVKMLKDVSTEEDEKDIISELKVLQRVGAHPNVVSFLGASVHKYKLHIIVEFCSKGSLLSFLRLKRLDVSSPLSTAQLAGMALQVASGMEYLASKNCIHRDLAARNVLVTEDLELKIADFGLARKLYESVYRPSGGKIPVKWMSPETILDSVYTTQSDVWSFGVVLWEMLTLGRTPYPGISAKRVIQALEQGFRLIRPEHCPQNMYALMLSCWEEQPTARPTFSELVASLNDITSSFQEDSNNGHYYNMLDECFHDDDQLSVCSDCTSCLDNETSCDCQYSSGYSSRGESVSEYLTKPDYKRTRRKKHNMAVWRLDSSDSGVTIPECHMTDCKDHVILSPVTDLDNVMTHKPLSNAGGDSPPTANLQSPYLQLLSGSEACLKIVSEQENSKVVTGSTSDDQTELQDSMADDTEPPRYDQLKSVLEMGQNREDSTTSDSQHSTEDMNKWQEDISTNDIKSAPHYDKLKIRFQPSTDSGCIASEVGSPCDLQRTERLRSDSTAPATGGESDVEVSSPQLKLSAHPRHRALFGQLGFRESDL